MIPPTDAKSVPMKCLSMFLLIICAVAASHGGQSPWSASWIWNDVPAKDMWFRKTLTAPREVKQAKIAVTADNRYELYVNGNSVGSDGDWTTLETYDVTRYVRKGLNVVAVKATDTGADLGALLLEGDFI